MRPVRVLYVLHLAGRGGAEMAFARLLASLDRSVVQPVAVLPEHGPLETELAPLDVPVFTLPLCWWIPATHWTATHFCTQAGVLAAGARAVATLARREAVDIIHTNTIVTLEGALAAAQLGIAHVWHSRGRFENGFPPAYFDHVEWIYSTVGRLSDVVVCTSEAVRVQAASQCPASRLEVIHDGFDPEAFCARPVAPRHAVESMCNLPAGERYVACVGGIQRRKGQVDLVEALALLGGAFSDLHLVVCGPGSDQAYAEALLARVRALGLESRVHLAGQIDDVRSVLAWCEMLVHPSHSEGFGLAVLEAMAAKRPVVATRSGGPDEIVEDGISGLLVSVGDPTAMAAAMRRVLIEPGLGVTLGEAAGTRARRFAGTLAAERITSLYLRLLCPSWVRPVRRYLRRHAARRTARELQARLDLLRLGSI